MIVFAFSKISMYAWGKKTKLLLFTYKGACFLTFPSVENANGGPKIRMSFIQLKNGDAVSEIVGGSDKRSIWRPSKKLERRKSHFDSRPSYISFRENLNCICIYKSSILLQSKLKKSPIEFPGKINLR